MSFILNFIELASKKNYYDLCNLLLPKAITIGLDLSVLDELDCEKYLIRDCLFVVRDMNSLLHMLKNNKNLELNKGTKTERAKTSSMQAYLGCLDAGYRCELYKFYNELKEKGNLVGLPPLYRSHFSFRGIHRNISDDIKY